MTSGEDPRDDDPAAVGKGAGPNSDADFDAAWMDIVSRFHDSGAPARLRPDDGRSVPQAGAPLNLDDLTFDDTLDAVSSEDSLQVVEGEESRDPLAASAPDTAPQATADESLLPPLPPERPERPEIDLDDPRLHRPDPLPAWTPAEAPDDSVFVPPTPPPLPHTTPQRRAAWLTVFGAPALLLLLVLAQLTPPRVLTFALIAGFLGAFGYLIATMSDTPRDPWDDGSRV